MNVPVLLAALVLVPVGLLAVYVVVPSLAKIALRRRFLQGMDGRPEAFLTFDDGPDPEVTPKLLTLLNDANVKATFFVVGKKAESCPELVAQMVANGHEIGEHTHEHYFPWTSGPLRAVRDLWGCKRVLDRLEINEHGRLFRPPFGKLNLVGLLYVALLRRRIAFWNVDPQDYSRESGEEVATLVAAKLAPGAVVLLHDGTTKRERTSGAPVVVDALKRILQNARENNLEFAPLGAAMARKP